MKYAKFLTGIKTLLQSQQQSTSANSNPNPHSPSTYQFQFSPTMMYTCQISQIHLQHYQQLYPQVTLQLLIKQFSQCLNLPTELLGKKSSQITISASRRYCCKLLDNESLQKYMQIHPQLWQYQHQQQSDKEGQGSYLAEIYRIFRVQSVKGDFRQLDYFVIMPSLRPQFEDIVAMYDLKGYHQGRHLDGEDFKMFKFGKDQNFLHSKELTYLQRIDKAELEKFYNSFSKDIKFLQSHNIIDYSLLIVFRLPSKTQSSSLPYQSPQHSKIHKSPTHLNTITLSLPNNSPLTIEWLIIDYLQEFNMKKKAENKFKLIFKKEVSSVEPELYAARFLGFVGKYFLGK